MSEQTTITRADLEALADKLDALDLTDVERAVLNAVFRAAGPEPEVEGFGIVQEASFLNAFRPGGKLGQVGLIIEGGKPGDKLGQVGIIIEF